MNDYVRFCFCIESFNICQVNEIVIRQVGDGNLPASVILKGIDKVLS